MPASKDKLPKSLKQLLVKDLLETDALNQISHIIRVTEEDTKLRPYYPGAFFYLFLVNQRSSVRDVLEKHFSFYKGDLLRDSYQAACDAERDHFNWEDSEGWEIIIDCMRGLAKALGVQKLNSGQIAASLLFPFNPFHNARKKRKLNWKNYNFKKFVLPEIDGGCYEWSDALIDKQLAALARDLVTYDGTFILDPHSIAHRYNILLTEVGDYIKVSVAERWGSHIVEPKQKGIITREGLWLPHKALFMPNEVSEFESLLNATPPTPEEAFQEFFQTYPHWLFLLGDYEEHMEQVQLRLDVSFSDEPEEKRWLQPDFLLKRMGLNV
ncbi:MAG: hypothetical protein KAW19_06980, partial [Candidatus Aminicenantes bacterium]|nr:hypothetical protein [Candidatus Aminicenantes bacterium]